jgi:hypothetical protein
MLAEIWHFVKQVWNGWQQICEELSLESGWN